MQKIVIALIVGLLIGSAATYLVSSNNGTSRERAAPDNTSTQPIGVVREVSASAAAAQREDRYASIKTIEDTLALPTDFAETEALYVIAGREDIIGVKALIVQAIRVSDPADRRAALGILLLRLTELDPFVALEIARNSELGQNASFERMVWNAWGRLDLDEALSAAEREPHAQKNNAAQALYASVRSFDKDALDHIRKQLKISPDRNARAQRVYGLAADSPLDAIRFIESRGTISEQQEEFRWLAYYLSKASPARHPDYSEAIRSDSSRKVFEQMMATYGVTSNPDAALNEFLRNPNNRESQSKAHSALQSLSQQDPEKALAFFDEISNPETRQQFALVIAQGLAVNDPQQALAWARENTTGETEAAAIATIVGLLAQKDPELALAEAQSIANPAHRTQAVTMAISFSMQSDPAKAVSMLSLVEDANTRNTMVTQLAQTWGGRDFDAALQWVSSLDSEGQRAALRGMTQQLVHTDVDKAIVLLDQFPAGASPQLTTQIVQSLVQQRSIDSAEAFVSKFSGSPEYDRLHASVVSAAAQTDPDRAMQMARGLKETRHHDLVVAGIVARKAASDPRVALQWAESIESSAYRQQALTQIATIWNQSDPTAASIWLQNLPKGDTRDDAIVAISGTRQQSSGDTLDIINTITDSSKRKRAKLGLVQRLLRKQPKEAERILSTIELSDAERMHYQQLFDSVFYNQGVSIVVN